MMPLIRRSLLGVGTSFTVGLILAERKLLATFSSRIKKENQINLMEISNFQDGRTEYRSILPLPHPSFPYVVHFEVHRFLQNE